METEPGKWMSGMKHEKENIMTDLSKFTNNEKRRAFFDERKEEDGWRLWFEEERLNRKYMRWDGDGITFVCELREQWSQWPEPHRAWRDNWYLLRKDDTELPFENYSSSISLCIEELKKMQKKRNENKS